MRKRVTISAPAGTLVELATIEGWERCADGSFIVTDPNWRDDVSQAFGARVVSAEDTDTDEPSHAD